MERMRALITNAIIYYNMALLSQVYAHKSAANDQQAMELIRGIAPVAWQHVNLFGTLNLVPQNQPWTLMRWRPVTSIRCTGARFCRRSKKPM